MAGRAAAPVLAAACPIHPDSALGHLAANGASPLLALIFACAFVAICSFVFSLARMAIATACLGGALYGLCRLARREGGMSGDFFGAAIVLTETAVLAACL